jgi:choline dehydrogenase-like flavoprotein
MARTHDEPDVIVVGSGLAGAFAARLLTDAGLRVLVIEAGREPSEGLVPRGPGEVARCDQLADDDERWAWTSEGMPGEWVRVRRPGGRSRIWGGWFSPCPATTFRYDAEAGSPWPFAADTMVRLQRSVAARLRAFGAAIHEDDDAVPDGGETGDETLRVRLFRELGVRVRARRSVTFSGRTLTALDLLDGVPLRTGLVAMHLSLRRGHDADGLVVRDGDGHVMVLPCAQVLLAASPIETARILLETSRVERVGLHDRVGQGLVDHLVVGRLVVAPWAQTRANDPPPALWIPRFVNVRGRRRDYSGGFSVEISRPAGLDVLSPEVRAALPAGCDGTGAGRFGVRTIHALGEMFPRPGRDLGLDLERRDALGRAVPRVRLFVHDEERRMLDDMDETCDVVAAVLGGRDAVAIPTLAPRETFLLGHEAGTCAMGADADHAVDLGGRVRGLRGVRVVDGSLMPTATDRHPTAALLTLTLAVASSLLRDLRGTKQGAQTRRRPLVKA